MPGASVKINDWLSVGGSLNAMYGYLDTEVAINTLRPSGGQMKLSDYEWGFGGVGSILITPREGTRIGVTYVSPVKLNFSDTPSFSNLGPIGSLPIFNSPSALNLGITVTLPMGSAYRFGLGTDWQVRESLSVNLAYEFMWCGDMSVNQTSAYRGDVVGAYENAWFSFVTVNATWRF